MHYFAKLIYGRTYFVFGKVFERGVELEVSEKEFNYLSKITEGLPEDQGNHQVIKMKPRFETRTEDFTREEKILEEVQTTEVSLGPKKPGPKPKDKVEE